jgi:hypothetical protein
MTDAGARHISREGLAAREAEDRQGDDRQGGER